MNFQEVGRYQEKEEGVQEILLLHFLSRSEQEKEEGVQEILL